MCGNIRIHYHNYENLSEGSEPVCQVYFVSSVCLRLVQLSYMQCMGLCVFNLTITLMMIVGIRVLYLIIIIKSEVCRCLGLGHETMVCAVYVFILACARFTCMLNIHMLLCILQLMEIYIYRKVSNIRRTKSQNLNASRPTL